MLEPIRMGSNMEQKHLSLSFATSVNLSLGEHKNIKIILFLIHEMFR